MTPEERTCYRYGKPISETEALFHLKGLLYVCNEGADLLFTKDTLARNESYRIIDVSKRFVPILVVDVVAAEGVTFVKVLFEGMIQYIQARDFLLECKRVR